MDGCEVTNNRPLVFAAMIRSAPHRYGAALALAGVSLALNSLLAPLIQTSTFPLFLAAVMLATWYGGLGPGLLATALTAIGNSYFFLAPGILVARHEGSNALRAALYVVSAVLITVVAARLRFERDRAEAASAAAERYATERRHAEEMARASETKFRGLLELAPDAIVIVAANGRIVLANTQAQKLFGYVKEDLIGQPVEMLMPEGLRHSHVAHRDAFVAAPRTRPMGVGLDLRGQRRDGTSFPVEISLAPMQSDEGLLVMSAIRDVSERKEAEARIRALNEDLRRRLAQLDAVNKELEAFSYSVSHDLRAPLRSIDGFSQALLEEYGDRLDDAGQDYLKRVRSATQRMGELIDDLLNLSRVTRRELRREPVDLTGLARMIVAQLQKTEPARRVDFQIENGLIAYGDAHLLRVALENLLGNAWKFTGKRQDARIEFAATRDDGVPVYYVRDNGVGFDMAYSNKLFGAFQRLHRSNEFPGTGIGLATVQRILTRHGGRVWAEADPGHGATFYFTL